MGLFGALIVRPSMGAGYAYDRADSQFNPSTEFLALLSEIDPYLNAAVLRGTAFNMNSYHPRYWLINGRGFPDSIADNFATWLPSQPYGSLASIHPLRPGHQPAAQHHPLPVRGDRGLPVPSPRQQRQGHRPRRCARSQGRPARTCRSTSSR